MDHNNIPVAQLVTQPSNQPVVVAQAIPITNLTRPVTPNQSVYDRFVLYGTYPVVNSRTQYNNYNSFPLQTRVMCRDCQTPFIRYEIDKGSNAYFRCYHCRKSFLKRNIINSCVLM